MTVQSALAKAGVGAFVCVLALNATAAMAAPGYDELLSLFSGIQNTSSTAILGVVNRPTSPVVTGLATDVTPDMCGVGLWGRGSLGTIETSDDPSLTVDFGGPSGGIDYGCADINGTGLDLRVGVTGGFGGGKGTVEGYPGSVSYQDAMYGIYASFAKNGWTGDLQLMGDHANYTAKGVGIVDDGDVLTTDQTGLSGYLGYTIALGDNMQLTPYGGFNISRMTASTLVLAGGAGTIELDPQIGEIAYVGAALAKTFILADQTSAIQPFASATYYADFSDDATVTVYPNGDDPFDLTLNTTGGFGEVSAGLNYVKLLDGEMGGAKQFTGTIRADGRFSDSFTGGALTLQGRLQY